MASFLDDSDDEFFSPNAYFSPNTPNNSHHSLQLRPRTPPSPSPPSLLAPSTTKIYPSLEALQEAVTRHALSQGYGLTCGGDRKDPLGIIKKRVLRCDRHGVYSDKVGERRQRKKTSRATGCRFEGYASRDKATLMWRFVVKENHDEHNHGPSYDVAHPVHCKLRPEDIQFIQYESQTRNLKPREILDELRRRNPGKVIISRDVYNAIANIRLLVLGAFTPLQALIYNLTKEEEWLFWHDVDEWDQLSALFFVHRSSIELLRKYHYILFLDCTYKTNRYGMPLLIITSTTACNLTFYVGFCFLQQETTEFSEQTRPQDKAIENHQ